MNIYHKQDENSEQSFCVGMLLFLSELCTVAMFWSIEKIRGKNQKHGLQVFCTKIQTQKVKNNADFKGQYKMCPHF